jgi:zinc protease
MMYRVGAKNEAAGTTGLAHYAEHMNFRATRHFPGHEITESVTRRGGRWTGYTWIDQTFYQTTLPREDLLLALDLEADRMGSALYDEKEFGEERTSVIAELRSYDDPHALLYDEVLSGVFQIHPYRNNTIGWLTDVEAVTRDVAYGFYRRFYHPRNAVLAVGGDFAREEALSAVRARFGDRPSGDEDAFVATVEPPPSGERRLTVRKPGPHAEVLLAFRAPALTEPDFPAMVLLDALLAGGKGLWFLREYAAPKDAPLERALVASGGARDTRSAFQASLQPYVYTLRATTPAASGLAAAESALFGALESASERDWSEPELRRARAEVRAGLARDLDTLAGRVHQLAFFEVSGGFEHLAGFEARLEATRAEEARRFARERLRRDQATVGWFVPTPGATVFFSGQAKPATPTTTAAPAPSPLSTPPGGSALPGAPAPKPSETAPDRTVTVRLRNGLTLHVTPRSSTSLLALLGRVDAGTEHEAKPGLAVLAADVFGLAAHEAGAPPLVLGLDDDLTGAAAARYLEFQATGLREDLQALARAVARGFGADAERLEEARALALARAEAASEDTEAQLVARARAAFFPAGSPLSRPPGGAVASLARSRAEVLDFLRRFVTPARAELSIAGPVDPLEVRRTLEGAFEEAKRPGAARDFGRVALGSALGAPRGPAAWTVATMARPDASQNTIHVVLAADRSRPHDRAATSLLLYLLGETYYSGRLGRALVEPGLVYSVATTLEEPNGLPGYLRVQTAASKEATPEVLRRIRDVLEGAARGAFTEAELAEAKTYRRGKAARGRDGALAAAALAFEHGTSGPSPQDVTLAQLNDTARRLFARGAPLALVGGPGE